jgi:hypothetical protein
MLGAMNSNKKCTLYKKLNYKNKQFLLNYSTKKSNNSNINPNLDPKNK